MLSKAPMTWPGTAEGPAQSAGTAGGVDWRIEASPGAEEVQISRVRKEHAIPLASVRRDDDDGDLLFFFRNKLIFRSIYLSTR